MDDIDAKICERIDELKEIVKDEDEELSHDSLKDLEWFIKNNSFTIKPYITVYDSGNILLTWRDTNSKSKRILISFRGHGIVSISLQNDKNWVSKFINISNILAEIYSCNLQYLITDINLQEVRG